MAAVDHVSPFPFGDANGGIPRNPPSDRLDPPDSGRSTLPLVDDHGFFKPPLKDSEPFRFSISVALFRENSIGNRFWESLSCHPRAYAR